MVFNFSCLFSNILGYIPLVIKVPAGIIVAGLVVQLSKNLIGAITGTAKITAKLVKFTDMAVILLKECTLTRV